nr:hypothetical protein [uncultured Devosia sp.]
MTAAEYLECHRTSRAEYIQSLGAGAVGHGLKGASVEDCVLRLQGVGIEFKGIFRVYEDSANPTELPNDLVNELIALRPSS